MNWKHTRLFAASAALGVVLAAPAFAQVEHIPGGTRATQDLNLLVQANLQEASTLRHELQRLAGNPAAVRVWQHMIRDHRSGADALAGLDRRWGGNPNTTPPDPQPVEGHARDIVRQTLQAHRDTLSMLRNMEAHADRQERPVLRKVEGVVRGHIAMLRRLRVR